MKADSEKTVLSRSRPSAKVRTYFYELHVDRGANKIEDFETADFDETPLLEHDRVPGRPGRGVKLLLKKRARLLDFFSLYRNWLVCSDRAAALFRTATKKMQGWPAPLWDQDEKVPGYCIVNLYEKLDCLAEEDVRAPDYRGGPKSFDPGRGNKVRLSVVKDRGVFRINYEQFTVLVSQSFRDQLERHNITGLGWLRRGSVP